jgi:citrate/tricarballylate utilization protein
MPGLDLFKEAERQLTICNSCRYCEGYCPVFPAIELRRSFSQGDVLYLSNLCHDCRACLYACMYSPPHEFSINIPKLMSDVRIASYKRWSWPPILANSFTNRRVNVLLAVFVTLLVALLSVICVDHRALFAVHLGPGAFYQVVPYIAMVLPGSLLFIYGVAIWIRGGIRFWSETTTPLSKPIRVKAVIAAVKDAVTLTYLKGGGPGCFYPSSDTSSVRRIYHALTFWGFLSAFASTIFAAVYQEFFHWLPPYSFLSAPVILGTAGGIGMIVGTTGLIWFKINGDPTPAAAGATGIDYIFLVTLGLAALSGLLTLVLRNSSAMGITLTLHLALVAALFICAPYGKFVHVVYRFLALVRNRVEPPSSR